MTRLLGRALFYLVLYSVYSLLVFTVVYRLYGFPERSRGLDLALFALPFLLACIFLALALGALFTRRETAMQVLLFTSLPSVFLAGFAWPLEAVPSWLRAASLLSRARAASPDSCASRRWGRSSATSASSGSCSGGWRAPTSCWPGSPSDDPS